MRHSSSSATLAQVRQNFTRSMTSSSTAESRRTSAGSDVSRWNAIRCAPFGPTPGSWPSSSMRLWTTPSYISALPACGTGRTVGWPGIGPAEAGQPGEPGQAGDAGAAARRVAETARRPAEASGEGAHLLLLQLTGRAVGVADRGEHEVSNGLRGLLRVGGVDGGGRDGELHQLALPVDDGLHEAAARRALNL